MSIYFGACRAKLVDHLPSLFGHFTCFSGSLGIVTSITLLCFDSISQKYRYALNIINDYSITHGGGSCSTR
jgi:hypothetical protein